MSKAELIELQKELGEARKKILGKGRIAIGKMFDDFFDKYPEILEVKWTQYTPFFNDGDACYFGMNEPCAITQSTLDAVASGEMSEYETYYEDYSFEGLPDDERMKALSGDLYEIFGVLEFDDLSKQVFGDHVKVKIKKGSIVTERYSDHN